MSNEFFYYDDEGNPVYEISNEIVETPSISFHDNFTGFRNKIKNNEYEMYDESIFIDRIEKILTQYPFIRIENMVEDYLSGISSFTMQKKYQIFSRLDNWRICSKYLGFTGKRATGKENSLSLNLENDVWAQKFKTISKNFLFFREELDRIFHYNFLRGFLILFISDNGKFDTSMIEKFKNFCQDKSELIYFFNKSEFSKNDFLNYLDKKIDQDLINSLKELQEKNIIFFEENKNFVLNPKLENLKEILFQFLDEFENGTTQINFNYKLIQKIPEIRFIPIDLIWNYIMNSMELEQLIIRKPTQVWMGRPFNDMLFTKNKFESTMQLMREQIKQFGHVKFFGRVISPDLFIDELIELDKGDFNDSDDQVTRLVGLCLADSVLTTAPHEELDDFDFSIDVNDYRFRPEQIEAMKNANFVLTSPIIHCKVMINESINSNQIIELEKKLPENHQGIIFSFMPLNSIVKKYLRKHTKIQVIDEEGVRLWVQITPNLPSRVGSVVKIQFDPINDNRGKIARLDSVNYETGMATITILPNLEQTNIHVRSLQEISLFEESNLEFINYSRNYFEFLRLISKMSNEEEFNSGIFEKNKFKNPFSKNRFNEKFYCSCNNFANFQMSGDSKILCRHIIAGLDDLARNQGFIKEPMTQGNKLYNNIFNSFISEIKEKYEALISDEDEWKEFFKLYIRNLINLKN